MFDITKTESKRNKLSQSKKTDIYNLYEKSVQNVEHEIEFMQETYMNIKGKRAYIYREDFCGTALSSCKWIKQGENFEAIAIDNDCSVLDWSIKNRLNKLNVSEQKRISMIESDVNQANAKKSDVLAAFNFSYFTFKTRKELGLYFKNTYDSLKDDGLLFLDLFGGSEAYQELEERTEHQGFTYVWKQNNFYPLTNFLDCSISFEFPDGTTIQDAFTYQWRLWTAPEIRELLLESGYKKVMFFWEGEDEEGEGNGEFFHEDKGEPDLSWIAYVVAEK